ncbi:MAG: FAD-dependent oxidoreductase, partial [Clostridia bacterium]|nr:FAD-dependent oxidoreductase [Clostridia bacterium]
MMKVIIIGGVAAGASCAARLRRLDESAEIILLERGDYISYANCGLPYHVGNVIRSRDSLLVTPAQQMRDRFKVDVRTRNEATAIDRAEKTVAVKNTETGEEYKESYDKLVIATGSSPLRPPIPGIDAKRIHTLWTVGDTDLFRQMVYEEGIKTAAVVGGGFIGLEMAENLKEAGVDVTILEALDQVMAPLDFEMAQMLHGEIRDKGVALELGDPVDSFEDHDTYVTVKLKSGKTVDAELVVLSIGVRPNSAIAKDAGLPLNQRGGILVDDYMMTEDPNIFAAGDVVEVRDANTEGRVMVPLAGPANKQGRIAADNIVAVAQGDRPHIMYAGTQGSSVVKVFDYTAACTGRNEKQLAAADLKKGEDYEVVYVTQNHHAGYYPGALPMVIKLIVEKADPAASQILGAQIVGYEGVDKRIDTLGVAKRLGATVDDLTDLELAYAPPYSSAKDPVNMAGFTAQNALNGLVTFADWNFDETTPDAVILDIREDAERMVLKLPNAVESPLGQLRDRLGELDKSKTYVVFCGIGVRAYNASRILRQNGFENVLVYPGGTRLYTTTHKKETATPVIQLPTVNKETTAPKEGFTMPADSKKITLDCIGLQCPGPIVKVYEAVGSMADGDTLEVTASDPGFVRDIGAWCATTGNTLISAGKDGTDYKAVLMKGLTGGPAAAETGTAVVPGKTDSEKTIVVFSGDMDKVMASFIIANGAAAMGKKVTMFFTFWGLAALRKPNGPSVSKSLIEHAFGIMLPKGVAHMGISKWNMG